MKVTYFQLWARGPSIVLALEHAGVDYEAAFPDNWKELKPTTPWGALPMFEAPLAGKVLTLGHELAILAYIERKCPAVAGADEREWAVSQQFVHQAEDVYKALVAKQPTLYEKDKVSKEALAEWWAGDDRTLHNRKQGLQVHLALLEAAAAATPGKAGYLTCDGKSVGECLLRDLVRLVERGLLRDESFIDVLGLVNELLRHRPLALVGAGDRRALALDVRQDRELVPEREHLPGQRSLEQRERTPGSRRLELLPVFREDGFVFDGCMLQGEHDGRSASPQLEVCDLHCQITMLWQRRRSYYSDSAAMAAKLSRRS